MKVVISYDLDKTDTGAKTFNNLYITKDFDDFQSMVGNVRSIIQSNYSQDKKLDSIEKLFTIGSVYEFDSERRTCEIFYNGKDHDYFEGIPPKELYIEIDNIPVRVHTIKPTTDINVMKYKYIAGVYVYKLH